MKIENDVVCDGVFGYGRLEIVVLDFQASLDVQRRRFHAIYEEQIRGTPSHTQSRGLRPGRANSNKNMTTAAAVGTATTTTRETRAAWKPETQAQNQTHRKRGQYCCDDVKGQQLLAPSVFGVWRIVWSV